MELLQYLLTWPRVFQLSSTLARVWFSRRLMRCAAGRFLTRSIWISGVWVFWGFSFCVWSRGELVFTLTWCCLLTSAVLLEPDRSKLGDPDILSDPGVRVAPFCCSCCAWNAVATQLSLYPGHMLATIKQQHLNRTFMIWC